jgi:hypothetical protein
MKAAHVEANLSFQIPPLFWAVNVEPITIGDDSGSSTAEPVEGLEEGHRESIGTTSPDLLTPLPIC